MSEFLSLPAGEIRDPSHDVPMMDEYQRWRIALDGKQGDWLLSLWWPSEALAANYLRRKQAVHDGLFGLLDGLDAEAAELRRQR